ncbi:MAG: site-2 protease family protein [Deltaproteobacteria bacterium]
MMDQIAEWIVKIPVLLFAITIHEYAHARTALFLGDPTAKQAGRITLNPISHLDPFGAICLFLFNFGWAKPVPVNPRYFRNPQAGNLWVSLAGPLANLGLALVMGMLIRNFLLPWELYLTVLVTTLLMNIGLGLFNLLPIPPLDGSHVLESLLPYDALVKYRQIERYAPIILLGVFFADQFLHLRIFSRILGYPIFYIAHLFAGDNLFGLMRIL